MGSFRYGPEGGATYSHKVAQQNMELKKNIAKYEKDLSQALGKIRSSQNELKKSMMAYTQHARALRENRALREGNEEDTSQIRRVSVQALPRAAAKKVPGKLPALERPLTKPLPPGELAKMYSSGRGGPPEELLERGHTIPPVRKSADIKGRQRSQDGTLRTTQKSRLQEIKRRNGLKSDEGSHFNNSATLVAWDAVYEGDDSDDDASIVETASTTAVMGDVKDDETLKREAQTKKLLQQAIQQLKDMESRLKLPPIKRKNRLNLSNPFDTIPETEEFSDVKKNIVDVISDARSVPKLTHKRKSRYVPTEKTIQENDDLEDDFSEEGHTFGKELKTRPDDRTRSKNSKKIRFLKAAKN